MTKKHKKHNVENVNTSYEAVSMKYALGKNHSVVVGIPGLILCDHLAEPTDWIYESLLFILNMNVWSFKNLLYIYEDTHQIL